MFMCFNPISIKNLSLEFPQKICFEHFSCQVPFGSRIAIIGKNGSGKSTLLKILQGIYQGYSSGEIVIPKDLVFGYVPQIVEDFDQLSGGERFNKAFTKALASDPHILLLDEPTNHLDAKNRKSLMRYLEYYYGTLIVVSHDEELLKNCVDTFWLIEDHKIEIFSGHFDDYRRKKILEKSQIKEQVSRLQQEKKQAHAQLMKEQTRAAKSRAKGKKNIQNKKWPTITSHTKASRSEETSGRKRALIDQKKAKSSR